MNNQSVENADHIDTTTLTSSGIITGQSGLSLRRGRQHQTKHLGREQCRRRGGASRKQNHNNASRGTSIRYRGARQRQRRQRARYHSHQRRRSAQRIGVGGHHTDSDRAPDTANRRVFRIDSTGMFAKGPISQGEACSGLCGALTVEDTQHANTVLKGSLSVSDAATFESSLAAGSISTSGTLLAHDADDARGHTDREKGDAVEEFSASGRHLDSR